MDQANEQVDFPLESPGKLIVSFFQHNGETHLLVRVAGANGGLAISPDELKEIVKLAFVKMLPQKSPRMTAVTDQVMAEIRDHQKELMKFAAKSLPDDTVVWSSGKFSTLIRACVLIALNELDRVEF